MRDISNEGSNTDANSQWHESLVAKMGIPE